MFGKSAVYVFLGLLTSSTIGALSVNDSSSAQKSPLPASSPGMTNTMPHGMGERHFIEMMIPHHQSAIEMADLALQRAKHPELKKMATAIKTDQTREIAQMQSWYKQWYGTDVPATSMTEMRRHHGGNQGMEGMSKMPMHSGMMGMNTDMDALKNAPDFDKEFIRQMVPHHQSAVMMAQMVLKSATHRQIRNLAQVIIKSQSAEVQQMQQWYQAWS